MKNHRIRTIILTATFLVGIASCGGGTQTSGVGIGGSQVSGGGIGGTGISQGPVTQFGSIFVNGVEFNTANATIVKDGSTVTQSNLQLGMVVTVDGSIDNSTSGTADTVTYTKELEGPITAITANTLTVLGQTVVVDNLTHIIVAGVSSPIISSLNINDTVEVSGLLTANGIRATYIEKKSPSVDVELKGVITGVGSNTLSIGTLTVNISAIVPSFTPAVGDYVEVKGTLVGSNLAATSLERKSRALGTSKEKAELQGYVTSATSTSDFVLDAQRVHTTPQTAITGGAPTDIKIGVRLEVEGTLSNGILVATKLSFEDDLSLEGNVLSVNGNDIILDTYSNVTIEINDILTEGATTLNTGDHVKVRGRKLDSICATSSCLLATEVESSASSGSSTVELQGRVDALDKNNQTITVLGTLVNVATIANFSGDGINDINAFFNAVKIGSLVELKGTQTGGSITWQSIDLED